LRGKQNEIEREGVGALGARGQGRAGLGWVRTGREGSQLHAQPLTEIQL
jgi:hypothetical protein